MIFSCNRNSRPATQVHRFSIMDVWEGDIDNTTPPVPPTTTSIPLASQLLVSSPAPNGASPIPPPSQDGLFTSPYITSTPPLTKPTPPPPPIKHEEKLLLPHREP